MQTEEHIIRELFVEQRLAKGLNPDALFEYLVVQGFTPVFLETVKQLPVVLPDDFLSRLTAQAREEAVHRLEAMKELNRLAERFQECGVNALVLKGAALCLADFYQEPGHRPSSDIDLFVADDDFECVFKILESIGYIAAPAKGNMLSAARIFEKPGRFGLVLNIDLHRRISNSHHRFAHEMNFERLMAGGRCVQQGIWVPSPMHMLLHAGFHRAQHFNHMGDRLIWLYDVHLLTEAMDDAQILEALEVARDLDVYDMVLASLAAAQFYFPSRHEGLVGDVLQDEPDRSGYVADSFFFNLASIPKLSGRVRFVLQTLFPGPRYLMWDKSAAWYELPSLYLQRWWLALKMLSLAVRSRLSKRAIS